MAYDLKKLHNIYQRFTPLYVFLPAIIVFGFIFLNIVSVQSVKYQKMIVLSGLVGSGIFTAQMLFLYFRQRRLCYLFIGGCFFLLFFILLVVKSFYNWHIIG